MILDPTLGPELEEGEGLETRNNGHRLHWHYRSDWIKDALRRYRTEFYVKPNTVKHHMEFCKAWSCTLPTPESLAYAHFTDRCPQLAVCLSKCPISDAAGTRSARSGAPMSATPKAPWAGISTRTAARRGSTSGGAAPRVMCTSGERRLETKLAIVGGNEVKGRVELLQVVQETTPVGRFDGPVLG